MAKNNIYTKSYIKKMIFESGLYVADVTDYSLEADSRRWTILVNGQILITCVKDSTKFWFNIYGPNDVSMRVETLSGKVLISSIKMLQKT